MSARRRRWRTILCPKLRHKTEIQARTALARIKNDARRRECRAYKCDRCDGWHLTSMAANPQLRVDIEEGKA